jgi:hypothetical protein
VPFTLADLKTKARLRSDMRGSTFISDPELLDLINASWTELYELLVAEFEDYFVSTTTFATVNAVDTYDLSAYSIFKLRGVDLLLSNAPGNFLPLDSFEWAERENYIGLGAGIGAYTLNGQRMKYLWQGSSLKLAPVPDGAWNLKITFIPKATLFASDTDPLPTEVQPGWEEYIALDVAIQMKSIEESDTSALEARKARLKKRIEESASNRDAEKPHRMVRRTGGHYPFGYQGDDGEGMP